MAPIELGGIQMLRGFAAIAVVLHHALEAANGPAASFSPAWLTIAGAAGVDVFFVISGFIMYHTSFRPGRVPATAPAFLVRRATRIYPLYWVCLAGMLTLKLAGFMQSYPLTVGGMIDSVALLPSRRLLLGVAWTLVYELFFYLVFAATLSFRSGRASMIGTFALIIGILVVGRTAPPSVLADFLSNPIMIEFLFGIAVAWLLSRVPGLFGDPRLALPITMVAAACMAAAPAIAPEHNGSELLGFSRLLLWGAPAALIVAGMLAFPAPRSWAARRAIDLGNASYALYLTHSIVILAYGRVLKIEAIGKLPQVPLVLIVLAASIVIALVTHRFVERPLLNLGTQFANWFITTGKLSSGRAKSPGLSS